MIDVETEVADLSQILGLALPAGWAEPLRRFERMMGNYLEYQISVDKGELGVITLGQGPAFLDLVEAHLSEMELEQAGLAIFGELRRQAGQATWGLKLSPGAAGAQLYIKKPLPLGQVLAWLKGRGLSREAEKALQATGAELGKSHTHFVGVDFAPEQAARFQIYFTQYVAADKPVAARLGRVMTLAGLPDAALRQFEQGHDLLAHPRQTIWVSVGVVEGALPPSLKLDYGSVPLQTVASALERWELEGQRFDRLRGVAERLQARSADYVGVRFRQEGRSGVSVYFTRVR